MRAAASRVGFVHAGCHARPWLRGRYGRTPCRRRRTGQRMSKDDAFWHRLTGDEDVDTVANQTLAPIVGNARIGDDGKPLAWQAHGNGSTLAELL